MNIGNNRDADNNRDVRDLHNLHTEAPEVTLCEAKYDVLIAKTKTSIIDFNC